MPETSSSVDHAQMANAIRALSMDAVQKANSGHPGMPMGMADVATVLFTKFLRFDPAWPEWPNRDRFVLSAGHGSMLLYSLLHLTGYAKPTIEDIKNFRQLHAPCAGHPEYDEMPGIETTTGPLGQGLATAVGLALGERLTNHHQGDALCNHYTYVIAGDGCLMEGISQEAISMAGHLKLGKMILLWDDNDITIDGSTDLSTSDDQAKRFEASGWHVQAIDGHDPAAIEAAISAAQADDRPSMIACKTTIGFGSPNKGGTSGVHGAPLGDDEIALTRKQLGWEHAPFVIPADIKAAWEAAGKRSADEVAVWQGAFEAKDLAFKAEYERRLGGDMPANFVETLNSYKAQLASDTPKVATRKASEMALGVFNDILPETIGGSADLTGSNNTKTGQTGPIQADDFGGRYVYYGIREFGMSAVMNGLSLYGGYRAYGGTFLVFSDYARGAMRLSALMKRPVVYVMTHDSIGLGEDGPTHQPVEHVASLRAMPNMHVIRPADAVETAEAWALALSEKSAPTTLALTRQNLPAVRTEHTTENMVAKGGYILSEASSAAKVILIATGSEVEVALNSQKELEADGIATRVVSMPSCGHFDQQSNDYQQSVLGGDALKVSIEAGTTFGWHKYVGMDGLTIGMDTFGASAPAGDLFEHFGFTVANICKQVKNRLTS